VNQTKISAAKFEDKLTSNGVEFAASKTFYGIYSVKEIQKVLALNLVADGFCSIQDESAFLPVKLLNPQKGQWVLDACAAPGGKFTQILEAGEGSLNAVAVDTDKLRLLKVKESVKRLGLNKAFFVVADGTQLPFRVKFDRILIDAPCSGLGVIRKHPDIKWRRQMKEIVEFSSIQRKLLKNSQAALSPGGLLVYSTCTIDPLENQTVVEEFVLEHNESAQLQHPSEKLSAFTSKSYIQTLPHLHECDGSFAALIQKNID
jgi:16S rRNA (cytosine967-C5)-methyltransferase